MFRELDTPEVPCILPCWRRRNIAIVLKLSKGPKVVPFWDYLNSKYEPPKRNYFGPLGNVCSGNEDLRRSVGRKPMVLTSALGLFLFDKGLRVCFKHDDKSDDMPTYTGTRW